jgi:5-phospho-D-xylono-1,4-lactonase
MVDTGTVTGTVRTVLGDIDPADLGVCDAHDHLFFASARLPGQELDDPAAATAELAAFAALGGRAVAQWTPHGLGRRATDVVAASKAAGVHVIAATGFHQIAHYDPAVVARVGDRFAELFISELTEGIRDDAGPEPAKAGIIKVAGAFHQVDEHARRTMAAAAEAHHATDALIAVHLEHGTAPLDVLDVLCDTHSVPPNRVILGHLNRFPDSRIHRQAAEAGSFLAFDGPSRANHATDWRLLDALIALAEAGHTSQLLLGGDTVTADARSASGGGPGMPYLLRVLRPRIERELGPMAATAIFVDNPARAFTAQWR